MRIGGAVVMAVTALPYAAGGLGLWKGRFWGWVIGVAVNLIITLIFIQDAISEQYVAWDDAAVTAIFPVLLVMLWLPPVRRWCRRRPGLRQRASVVGG